MNHDESPIATNFAVTQGSGTTTMALKRTSLAPLPSVRVPGKTRRVVNSVDGGGFKDGFQPVVVLLSALVALGDRLVVQAASIH